jgi:cytochrome P450
MSLNPAILKRAQAELDSITDRERLPSFDDKDRLPYMHAVILEVLRYNTVTPLGAQIRLLISTYGLKGTQVFPIGSSKTIFMKVFSFPVVRR